MARRRDAYYKKDPILDEIEPDETAYDAGFVLDPAKIFDELPQPFRLIDKTLDYILDKTWEAIRERESRATELGLDGKLPVFDNTQQLSELCQATLLCSSLDGKFMFVVARNGVMHALDAETSCVVAANDKLQGLKVVSPSTGCLEENKHFICLLMENGTAAIFVLSGSNLHLLRVFNEDFGVKGSLTSYINVSFDGSYLAVGWKIPLKSSWLEIYKVPKEFWINEISIVEEKMLKKEVITKGDEETPKIANDSLNNDSSDSENESSGSRPTSLNQSGAQAGYLSETCFAKPTLMLKIKAPTHPVPNPASNLSAALKNIDQDYDVLGTGTNHILLQAYFDHSDKIFRETHQQYLQYLAEKEEDHSTRLPKVHFLTPGRFVPAGIQTAPDQVNSVVIHWSEASHALIYSLVKSPKDVERKPDLVLTKSSKILVSDVSVCRSYISFGLDNNNIVTWDKLTGLPLTVVTLPSSSTIADLRFVPTIKESDLAPSHPKLLVCCADGDLYMVQFDDDGETTVANLPSSSYDKRDAVVQVASLPNLPQLVLIQRNSGDIMLVDISTKMLKCQIGLVKPLTILNGFCYTQATSTLYMKGGRKDEYNEDILPESVYVFKMKVDVLPVVKTYLEEPTKVETSRTLTSFDKRIAAIEQQRISSYDERQRNYRTRWRQLEAELDRIKRPTSLRESVWFTGTVGVRP